MAAASAAKISVVTERPRSVVLVENDWVAALERADALVRSGWRVDVSSSASEALATLERLSPDAILVDLVLDGAVSGLELARRIKRDARLRRVPVIGLTSMPFDEILPIARAVGCSTCLTTPCTAEDVMAAIESALTIARFPTLNCVTTSLA